MPKLVFYIVIVSQFFLMEACPKQCVCNLYKTSCYWQSCEDEVLFEETYVLHIHGSICENQKEILKSSLFSNTIKWIHDDQCGGIPNCRYKCMSSITT